MKIGIIGMGKIGHLLAGSIRPEHTLLCYSHSYAPQSPPKTTSVSDLIKKCEIIFVSPPSKITYSFIEEIAPMTKGKTIINTSVGFTEQMMEKKIQHAKVIQLIPSIAGEDNLLAYFGYVSSKNETRLLEKIFRKNIQFARFKDDEIPDATALISCYPAFIYELIAKTIKKQKFLQNHKTMQILAIMTAVAASKAVKEKASGEFNQRIKNKGGATEAGLGKISKTKANNALSNALNESARNIKIRIKKYSGKTK